MMSTASLQPDTTGRISFGQYETWYAIYGDLNISSRPPLIALHGGPAGGHDYLRVLGSLYKLAGIPVVLYDQVGCGRSTHLPNAPPAAFSIKFFLVELDNFIAALGIRSYHLFGHSWGGFLAWEHSVRQPSGLLSLVLEGCPASIPLGEQVRLRCYNELPRRLRDAIFQHEKDGKATADYEEAMMLFRKEHLCRANPLPQDMTDTINNMRKASEVLSAMVGPSNISTTGTLEGWSIIDRLHFMKHPVLVTYGKYDYCGAEALQPYQESDLNIQTVCFEEGSHVCHLEEVDQFLRIVADFIV